MADAVEDLPVYKQIRRCIAERIERGDYPTGSMIPSENELAEEFGTTRLTIRSAMDELVKSGQIRRVQGKGAFVGHKWFDEHERKGGFRQSVLASGATPSVRILARSNATPARIMPTCLASPATICFTRCAAQLHRW
ncbi:MAG: GntR family transcriptional regulator [Collinsella sp.]